MNDVLGALEPPIEDPTFVPRVAVSAFAGFATTVIWALTGAGYFWPAWVWLGVAIPIALQLVVRAARRPGAWFLHDRALATHAGISGVVVAVVVLTWAFAGAGSFWPVWVVYGLALPLGAHALWVVLRAPRPDPRLTARVDELTRTRRGALDVQAAELRRIERDLHDGAQARLVALTLQLGRAEERLEDRPEVAELVRRARTEAGAAISELRDLARGIAPPVLADRGLGAAVEALARRSAMPVTVHAELAVRPPAVVETAAYFVVSEALANVGKHAAGAPTQVWIAEEPGQLVVEVDDQGPGGADPHGGGLTGLRHRVEALDGLLLVRSAPGEGTTIRAELPCAS
jgi:signal transduction histidine kinase